ncbi:MAG: hypothetical protein Sapg2KO_46740 [Saprospiraceae bacterium]
MKQVVVIMLTLWTFQLSAQFNPNIERKGFVFGVGLSGGVISISESNQEVPFSEAQGGIGLPDLKFGWMAMNERLAFMVNIPGMIYEYEGKDRSFDAIVPSIQYWVKDRWWINGGLGLAVDGPALYEKIKGEDWNFGCAVIASTGYEIVQRKNFAMDLQTKLQMGRAFMDNDQYRDGVVFSLGLGFNWY